MSTTIRDMLKFYKKFKNYYPIRKVSSFRQTITNFFRTYYYNYTEDEIPTPIPSEWDYEVTMTVGDGGDGLYGYEETIYGSLTPEYTEKDNNLRAIVSYWGDWEGVKVTGNVDVIEIGGIEFNGGTYDGYNNVTLITTPSNPFPSVGNTCTIKIKLAI